ncbi:hypothetical protein EGW08_013354 [Elysia chlorotica]|uniref:Uncharacterized protein n=1 Tax=Elysia chlorotica TaxID=188477 RepID=A0A3S0ZZA4_ELYCH|nr:hypothetical protein EGW08_013354 [Elysia chlorotica]
MLPVLHSRTPQPFSLLDEVLHRLAIPRDKLSALYAWKRSSVTLSSERVREVASCCCSNVSIRLPQSGDVTLLPLATLREIEAALRKQGSSAWLVGSAGALGTVGGRSGSSALTAAGAGGASGAYGRPASAFSGGVMKIKKEPVDFFGSSLSSSSSSSSMLTSSSSQPASFPYSPSLVAGKANLGGGGYRQYNFSSNSSSISGGSHSSHNSHSNNNTSSISGASHNNNSSSSGSSGNLGVVASSPSPSGKPESVRRSDTLSRVPILTKLEQQAGHQLFSSSSSDLLTSSTPMSSSFRSKQVLQPARDLFHPASTGSATPKSTNAAFKAKTSPSPFSLASATSLTTATTTPITGTATSSTSGLGGASSTSFFSKHNKLKTSLTSFPFSSSSTVFSSSLSGLNQARPGGYPSAPSAAPPPSSWAAQPHSSSSSSSSSLSFAMSASSAPTSEQQRQQSHHGHQGPKKSDHQRSSHHHHHQQQQQQQQGSHNVKQQQHQQQQQQQQQRSTPTSHTSSSSYKGAQSSSFSSKEGRNSTSGGGPSQRKGKKEDPEGTWLNTPMFSDDSSSSPFHTSIDFDSENSN